MSSLQQVLQSVVGAAYQIERELPGAGMSRVFQAREPALGRDVVIKVLPPDLVSTSSLQRFTREIQVTARLQHPYILPVITAGGNDDLLYYVTPFIRGESLRARLASGEAMSFADATRVGEQLLQAVAFAHDRGVIHRDIKPGNILVSEGHAILADFGIASLARGEHAADHADHMTGSTLDSARAYTAPEQPRDEARDLFATAVVIHEMATGVPGVPGLSATAIAATLRARHRKAQAEEIRKLAAVLSRALSVDPAARYPTASAMRAAIHAVGRGSRRQLATGVALGGIVTVLAAGTFALNSPSAPQRPGADSVQLQLAAEPVPGPASTPAEPAKDTTAPAVPAPQKEAPSVAAKPPMTAIDSAFFMYRSGEMAAAGALFQQAAKDDPSSARAQLGIAIATGANNTPPDLETARVAAGRALADSAALDAHDRGIAQGFLALADRRFPDACAAFERARQARESFESWFGLGECRARDDAVVFDATGAPQFRSGYATAFKAYVAAARAAAPHAPEMVYRRLAGLVPQTSADARVGRTDDRRTFVGNWRIVGDTLGFVLAQGGAPRSVAPEVFANAAAAAKMGRDMLRPMLLSWVRQSPREATAHEMLALLLENGGTIAESGDDRVSALGEIARARALEREPATSLRLAIAEARMLLRSRRYEQYVSLADSLLAAHPDPAPGDAEGLMPLALITGRIDRASKLLARVSGTAGRAVRGADGRPVDLPATVVSERADFLVRASLGVCDARVQAYPKRMVEVLDAAFPGGVPRGVEASFMERIVVFALPCLGPSVVSTLREPGRMVATNARAFTPGDTSFAADYRARERTRPPLPAGAEGGVDGVIADVLVKLAVKDSATALKTLTLALDRIPIVNRGVLSSEWSAGSIGRGMALAAEVSSALGDHETAQRWSSAVATLWRNADPELQPQVARMRAIARATPAGFRPE